MVQPKRVFKIGFWIGFAFCVLPAFIHCFYAESPISTVFIGIVFGLVWGLIIGGLAVLGLRVHKYLQSKDDPPDGPSWGFERRKK